jgi:hypothetical protein
VNLNGLTCIQKFEIPLQVANMTKIEKFKKSSNFQFEIKLELVFTATTTVETR